MEAGLVSMYSKHLEASQLVPAMPDSLSAHRRSPRQRHIQTVRLPLFLPLQYLPFCGYHQYRRQADRCRVYRALPVNTGLAEPEVRKNPVWPPKLASTLRCRAR